MNKTILTIFATVYLTTLSAMATSFQSSVTCTDGKGDDVVTVTYNMFDGVTVDLYLTSYKFEKESIVKNADGEIVAFSEKIVRYAEGEEITDKNVTLKLNFVKSSTLGSLLVLNELSMNGEAPSAKDVRVLKCK